MREHTKRQTHSESPHTVLLGYGSFRIAIYDFKWRSAISAGNYFHSKCQCRHSKDHLYLPHMLHFLPKLSCFSYTPSMFLLFCSTFTVTPPGDSIVFRRDFNTHVGNDKVTWKEVIVGNGPPNLNSSSVLLLDFWVSHRFSIINTMLKLKVVHRWSWYLATLGRRLMIDFVVVSSDLQSHILDNRMKTGWSCKLTPT